MTEAEAEALPRPRAATGVVFHDAGARTLVVGLAAGESGYMKLLWREGWSALRRAWEAGWPAGGPPWVWADVPGAYRVVHGLPTEGGTLTFTFPAGTPDRYAELVSRPGLSAIVTMDIGTRHILGVKFVHRPEAA